MNIIRITHVILLGSILALLSACGGGGSGGNGGAPAATGAIQANIQFPIGDNFRWNYNNSTTAVYFQGTRMIAGYETHALNHPTGAREYYWTNTTDILYLGGFVPTIITGNGSYQADITLNQPIQFYSNSWSTGSIHNFSGQGIANISPTYGARSVTYSGYAQYIGTENITVPAGNFTAKHIQVNFSITAVIDGYSITIPFNTQLWLADNIGIVRRIEQITTFNLTDTTNLPEHISFMGVSGASQLPVEVPLTIKQQPVNANNYRISVVYEQAGDNWLNIETDFITNNYVISPSTTDLVPGNRVARLTLTSAGGASTVIIVNYTLVQPVPEYVNIQGVSGGTELPGVLPITFAGQAINANVYTIGVVYEQTGENWLNVTTDNANNYIFSPLTTSLTSGTHVARITLTSAGGVNSVIFVSYTLAEPGLTIPASVPMSLRFSTMAADAARLINVQHTGEILQFNVNTSAPWLIARTTGPAEGSMSQIEIQVDYASMDFSRMYNGTISITYSGTYVSTRTVTIPVSVDFQVPVLNTVAPYVLYAGLPGKTKIRGEKLTLAQGHTLVIGGTSVSEFTVVNDKEIRLDYPGLALGDHVISVSNNSGVTINGPTTKVIASPVYFNTDVVIYGRPESMDYDPERQAFYVVTWGLNYATNFILQRIQYRAGSWHVDIIPIVNPQAVTLTNDGSEILVSDSACQIHHVDPVRLAITRTVTSQISCYYTYLETIHSFNDGKVLVADTNQWPTVWEYPGFISTSYPSIHNPNSIISGDRSRMIWAESPTISDYGDIYYYDANSDFYIPFSTPQSGKYYLYENIALSGDATRFAHYQYIYDENMSYLGSLEDSAAGNIIAGLNWNGTRAVAYTSTGLKFFDLISTTRPFPQIGNTITIDPTVMTGVSKVYTNHTGDVAFVFGNVGTGFRMIVRNLSGVNP